MHENVIQDLRNRRDQLSLVIESLEAIYGTATKGAYSVSYAPESVTAAKLEPVKKESPKSEFLSRFSPPPNGVTSAVKPSDSARVGGKPGRNILEEVRSEGTNGIHQVTIPEAILKAVGEAPRTSIQVTDRAEKIRPFTSRAAIQNTISVMLKERKIAKDETLHLHLVSTDGHIIQH